MVARREIATVDAVSNRIHLIRNQKVMLDEDLATLYGVTTKRFNEQVRRNLARFPGDFMFQLTEEEHAALRSQIATSKVGRGGRRYTPYAFTEHGAIMAATILNSQRATEMSVFIVRAFVQLREALVAHRQVAQKLDELERKVLSHDQAIAGLIDAIRQLMTPPAQPKRPIDSYALNVEQNHYNKFLSKVNFKYFWLGFTADIGKKCDG